MTAPRMTTEQLVDRCAPDCPHCGGVMDASSLTLEDLAAALPLPERVEVQWDGYAHHGQRLVVSCPACEKLSAVAVDWFRIKLIALRTPADDQYIAEREALAK